MKILLPLAALAALAGCVSVVPYGAGGTASPTPAAHAPLVPPTIVAKPTVKAPKDRWGAGTSPTRQDLAAVSAPAPLVAVAVGAKGAVVKTTDGGVTWEAVAATPPLEDDLQDVHFLDALTGWALGAKALYATEDGGRTWTTHDLFADLDPLGRPERGEVVRLDDLRGAFVARGHVFTTTDGGKTFTKVFAPAPVAGTIRHPLQTIAHLVAMGAGYGLWSEGALYRLGTTAPKPDGEPVSISEVPPSWGEAPVKVEAVPERTAAVGLAFPTPMAGWAVVAGAGQPALRRSTDGGRTWSGVPVTSRLADGAHPTLGFPVRNGQLHVAGDMLLLLGRGPSGAVVLAESKDAGATWVVSAAMDNRVAALAIPDAAHGYAVGSGGLLWSVTSN